MKLCTCHPYFSQEHLPVPAPPPHTEALSPLEPQHWPSTHSSSSCPTRREEAEGQGQLPLGRGGEGAAVLSWPWGLP